MSFNLVLSRLGLAACLLATAGQTIAQAAQCTGRNGILDALYRDSKPQDAAGCAMEVKDRKILITGPTTNPAMTCPDMFAWKLLAESIQQSFWINWASDQQTWPNKPVALCKPGQTPRPECCTPDAASNPGYDNPTQPGEKCPYFPGDHAGSPGATALRVGQPLSKAHATRFSGETVRNAPVGVGAAPDPEPGRKIRQSMAELVFRNKPMFDFVFKNDLYNQQGLQAIFARVSDYAIPDPTDPDTSLMPYRQIGKKGALVEIDFPVDAVMIKSNWISEKRAADLGLRDDHTNPYIKMMMKSSANDNNYNIFEEGIHWLVAFHISSKDIPNWVWTTFEHVGNPGRCDYTGCNDSYGYASSDTGLRPDQATNFTRPKTTCDNLLLSDYVFQLGETYPGGTRSQALGKVLADLKIGTGPAASGNPLLPVASDPAWNSYRLKGSQTEFTSSTGQATRLGNSVTEGGFVNSSSCISCHARASLGPNGSTGPIPLSVFVNEASDVGYLRSVTGVPDPSWYATSRKPATPLAVQTDFVWGFLAASCIADQVTPGCPAKKAPANALGAAEPEPRRSIRSIIRQ